MSRHKARTGPKRKIPKPPAKGDSKLYEFWQEIDDFKITTDPADRLEITKRATRKAPNTTNAYSEVGGMCLELAVKGTVLNPDERLGLFETARESFRSAIALDQKQKHEKTLKARMINAHMGIFQHLALDVKPSPEIVEDAYLQNLQLGLTVAARINDPKEENKYRTDRIGAVSELAILGLLQHFSVTELGDSSFLALPSFFSEDYSHSSRSKANSWDVSVYTDLGEGYDLSYKIQSKTYNANRDKRAADEKLYSNDIVILDPSNDLTSDEELEHHYYVYGSTILGELQGVLEGDRAAIANIGRRTSVLLDLLDV